MNGKKWKNGPKREAFFMCRRIEAMMKMAADGLVLRLHDGLLNDKFNNRA